MKKITLQPPNPTDVIQVSELNGNEIVAYRTYPSGTIMIATKIRKTTEFYGFIAIKEHLHGPSYISDSFHHCVKKAARDRDVYVFDSYIEFAQAIISNKF